MAKQTLTQAIHLATSGKSRAMRSAAVSLDGKPVGGWPETEQARRQVHEDLPFHDARDYTLDEFVSAMYTVDSSDRYRANIYIEEQRQVDATRARRRAEQEVELQEAFAACPQLSVDGTRIELDTDGYVVQHGPGPALSAEQLGELLPANWLAAAKRVRELLAAS